MKLRTKDSFWLANEEPVIKYPPPKKDLETEIVVIGGGITGALVGYALITAGYKIVLIDKQTIGMGSTAASSSMLQYEIDLRLNDLAKMIGEKEAPLCYKAGVDAILYLKKLIASLKIDCGFKMKRSLYLSHNAEAEKDLREEFIIRNKYGLGVKWLNVDKVQQEFELLSHGGILSQMGASVNAYKLTQLLIENCHQKGMNVFEQTESAFINERGNDVEVITQNNYSIKCKKVIFCTGYETIKMLKEKLADLFYTYVCVSKKNIALNKNLHHTLVWDTNEPYTYMRTTYDGRFLVGGGDCDCSDSSQEKITNEKAVELISKASAIIPSLYYTNEFSWSGVFGSTRDGLPYIGVSPEYKNAIFVLGFGGNGITFSVQGMDIVTKLLQGKDHPLAYCYRFGR